MLGYLKSPNTISHLGNECLDGKNLCQLNIFLLFLSLRYNCLDSQAAISEAALLKSNECQVKKLL